MRRVYYMDSKRKQIVQEAMLQMRATADALGPELMMRLRLAIKDFDPQLMAWLIAQQGEGTADKDADCEPVDRKKNLLTILKFLEMKRGDKNLNSQVMSMLAEDDSLKH